MRFTDISRYSMAFVALFFLVCIWISAPLWGVDREFPTAPLAMLFLDQTGVFSKFFFIGINAALVLLVLNVYTKIAAHFLTILILISVLCDQTRLQPWVYQFTLFLFVLAKAKTEGIAAVRLMIPFIYFWSGVQKLNFMFYSKVAPWFVEPFQELPDILFIPLSTATLISPLIEIVLGLLLFSTRLRTLAVTGLVATHLVILITVGPWGHNVNEVIWPWNVLQIILLVLFFQKDLSAPTIQQVKNSFACTAVTLFFCFMPLLNLFGYWDSYLSFSLYSGDVPYVEAELPKTKVELLGPIATSIAVSDPQHDYVTLKFFDWAMQSAHITPYPEKRVFEQIFRQVCSKLNYGTDVTFYLYPKPSRLQIQTAPISYNCSQFSS